jgi:hypothetical protein
MLLRQTEAELWCTCRTADLAERPEDRRQADKNEEGVETEICRNTSLRHTYQWPQEKMSTSPATTEMQTEMAVRGHHALRCLHLNTPHSPSLAQIQSNGAHLGPGGSLNGSSESWTHTCHSRSLQRNGSKAHTKTCTLSLMAASSVMSPSREQPEWLPESGGTTLCCVYTQYLTHNDRKGCYPGLTMMLCEKKPDQNGGHTVGSMCTKRKWVKCRRKWTSGCQGQGWREGAWQDTGPLCGNVDVLVTFTLCTCSTHEAEHLACTPSTPFPYTSKKIGLKIHWDLFLHFL